jgi:hypothetical protein
MSAPAPAVVPAPRGMAPTKRPVVSGRPIRPVFPTVAAMPLKERFCEVLERTGPLLKPEIQEEFAALLSPWNLVIMAGTMAVWGVSHYFGVGFVVDGLLVIAGVLFLGVQVIWAASDFYWAIKLTADAKTDTDLDAAAQRLANFVAVVGVAVFSALVMKGAKRVAPTVRGAIATAAAGKFGGFTGTHFQYFQWVAKMENRIIAVRNTNPLSTHWIERGYPAKGIDIKIKTSKTTGIVTAVTKAEYQEARAAKYFVVDDDLVPRNSDGQALEFPTRPEWPLEPGQVIDAKQLKPLVGDYDLLGVIDPDAPGRNMVLATSNGKTLLNWTNPEVERIRSVLNSFMDQPRVMHGAHDGFADVSTAGPVTVFFPDQSVTHLTSSQMVSMFYLSMGRRAIIKPQ